jgi:uncharacterized membrane protein YkoI
LSRAFQALLAFSLFLAAPVRAVAEDASADQDEARAAVESGAILPLEKILDRVKGRLPGEIVKVKLEHENGGWVYEFRVIDAQGHWRDIEVDAVTGDVTHTGDD